MILRWAALNFFCFETMVIHRCERNFELRGKMEKKRRKESPLVMPVKQMKKKRNYPWSENSRRFPAGASTRKFITELNASPVISCFFKFFFYQPSVYSCGEREEIVKRKPELSVRRKKSYRQNKSKIARDTAIIEWTRLPRELKRKPSLKKKCENTWQTGKE